MLQVKTADLEVVDQTPTQTGENTESFKNLGSFTKVASKATVSLTLDLRGLRYEEAKEKLEKYFDDCLFSGTLQFYIIHGYGTGAIRELVQSFLNKIPMSKVTALAVPAKGHGCNGRNFEIKKANRFEPVCFLLSFTDI